VTSYLKAERDRRQVRDAFSHYMSPVMVARLAANPSQLRLGGERREMTILFSDMRGFTTISEHLRDDPEQLTFVINSYFTKMTDRILEYAGTIDKYMGDAVMAFWNAPLTDLEHARHACHAALEMLDGLTKLNHRLKEQLDSEDHPFEPIEIGVGLNTGTCLVGNLGSEHRFSYSVLGDPVNLASRLEAQSKTYGVTIIIGETTQQQATDFATLEIDLIQVKGKHIPSRIYALLGLPRVRETDAFRALEAAHNDMLAAYREQDWRRAEEQLARCRALGEAFGLSTLYALYAARISSFRDVPPPANWDGVYVARSK
jgi:adenylate cyclase